MGQELPKTGVGLVEARHVNYDNAAVADVTGVVNAQNLTASADHTIAGQPDTPRNLIVTIVDTTPGITYGTITIYGKDANGDDISEAFDIAAGAGTYTGNKAFAYVRRVAANVVAALDGGGDETISVGQGTKFGLPMGLNAKLLDVYKACVNGADEAVGTVNKTYGTIIPTTAADNTRDFDFWYQCRLIPA